MVWGNCVTGAAYSVAIDWDNDGSFSGLDIVTDDVLSEGISIVYGRDQNRQLSPPAVGRSAFSLCNVNREFSPENMNSLLFGNLGASRPVRVETSFEGTTYGLHRGKIDDFEVHPDRSNRSVDLTSLDGLNILEGVKLSTSVYEAKRTGFLINVVLDEIGWDGPRDLDLGATHVPWWWEEGTDAFTAVKNLVLSEGPPAIAYIAPDGTFVFRDRHHRILREQSITSQASFAAARVLCDAPAVTGFSFTEPFVYQHGLRDIINVVSFDVEDREPEPAFSVIWSTTTPITIEDGETVTVDVVANDPFIDLQTLLPVTDVVWNYAVTLSAMQFRRSGQSVMIDITATGGTATITYMQVRGRSLPVVRTTKVGARDSTSIDLHGERIYPQDAPWVNVNDAAALASIIIAQYSDRRPLVQMRITTCDPDHLVQILSRTISDRITIRHDELGLNEDFFIEQVNHLIRRINPETGPIHAAVLGCERTLEEHGDNPFTFDKVGAGFDQGTFGLAGVDNPATVFIFDHPTQGQFDVGQFGT